MSPPKPPSPHDPHLLPPSLPVPQDDGACDHLGLRAQPPFDRFPPDLALPSTAGGSVDLAELTAATPTVLFFYPRTGVPGQPPTTGPTGESWDDIPGARGCTPQSCSFRDLSAEFAVLGVRVLGISTSTTAHQHEFVAREHIPFPMLSDSELRLTRALNLPTFEFPVSTGGPTTLIRRMAMFCESGRIAKLWYPVFPPDQNAQTVLDWLRTRASRRAACAAAADARRAHDQNSLTIRPLQPADRPWVRNLFTHHFGGTTISSRGQWINTETLPGLVAEISGRPAGVAVHTAPKPGDECELVALASTSEGAGVGSALLTACASLAKSAGCRRILLTTSNDNTDAMRFYQKRGWTLARIYPGSLAHARHLKPHVPTHGPSGIEVRDDLELEIRFA